MNLPDIYAYLDYRQFLAEWFQARKAANPRFSHRAFARRAGQRSPSLLLHVIDRKRNLTATTLPGFARALALKPDEAEHLAALVDFDQAETAEERDRAWTRVRAARRFRDAPRIEGDSLAYLAHWRHSAVRELAACGEFVADAAWIAARLRPNITPSEAQASLDLLERLGMLVQDADGRWVQRDGSLVTPPEVAGAAVTLYHLGMTERARDALTREASQERHYCAVTAAIPDSLLPMLKQELAAFQQRVLDLCDGAPEARTRVVQVNLQLFPLSEPLTVTPVAAAQAATSTAPDPESSR